MFIVFDVMCEKRKGSMVALGEFQVVGCSNSMLVSLEVKRLSLLWFWNHGFGEKGGEGGC